MKSCMQGSLKLRNEFHSTGLQACPGDSMPSTRPVKGLVVHFCVSFRRDEGTFIYFSIFIIDRDWVGHFGKKVTLNHEKLVGLKVGSLEF